MSTPRVLADTLALAEEEGLRIALLPAWYDIDEGPALARLWQELARTPDEVACHTRRFFAASPPLTQEIVRLWGDNHA
jgi:hypothetical protein